MAELGTLAKVKCPYCDEMLTVELKDVKRGNRVQITMTTTPESTAHVWTHAPKKDTNA